MSAVRVCLYVLIRLDFMVCLGLLTFVFPV